MNTPQREANTLVGIQVLRGMAALAVLLHHTLEELTPWLPEAHWARAITLAGAAGVDVFFVISGLVMWVSTQRSAQGVAAAKAFLQKRVLRIVPLYWAMCLLLLVMYGSGHFYKSVHLTAWDVVKGLFFWPSTSPILGVAWTLSYEFYFYLIFSVALCGAAGKARLGWVSTLLVAGWGLSHVLSGAEQAFLSNPIVLEFVLGLALAAWLPAVRHVVSRLGGLWTWSAVAGALMLAASFLVHSDRTSGLPSSVRFMAWGLPAALLVAAALNAQRAPKALLALGDASYSLYLVHAFVMTALAVVLKHVHGGLWASLAGAGAVATSIVLAMLSFRYVEPFAQHVFTRCFGRFMQAPAKPATPATHQTT